ncbi:MAG: zf-HC2 domain-containing protein [Candidatus Aminicenantes bacterium]|nr:zf-HC2 domain-containing protein [Candidatus Aminicenantes bacterium]
MSYRCYLLRRRFVRYLEGGVAPREAKRLEWHVGGCRECDELLARLRSGHEAGRQFGRLGPEAGHRPPEFEEIWAGIGATLDRPARPVRTGGKLLQSLSAPLAVRILIALVLAQSVLLVVSFRKMPSWVTVGAVRTEGGPVLQGYAPVRIAEFSSNSEFRVVTEGFVEEVYFDEHERSLHIRLVEAPHKPAPFVICEIRDLGGLTIPRPGSRVRVYGTARYDAQPGRGWHEVNPVLAMAVLKR